MEKIMRSTESLSELRTIRRAMPGVFGLIPTMGALHEGHASLIRRARLECDHVGVSIFVNPTQFIPGEDLAQYPRTIENDLSLLSNLGVDVVFTPMPETMYSDGYQTWIEVGKVAQPLEGAHRPGHFCGVATVVAKLFHAFSPDRAYFGQKDAQQVAVLRRMVTDLNFPVEMVVGPTVRESDGLALSSRNAYLNAEERKAAPVLYQALLAAKVKFDAGERNADMLQTVVRETIATASLVATQYVSIVNQDTFEELSEAGVGSLISLAARIGTTRLIDNIIL